MSLRERLSSPVVVIIAIVAFVAVNGFVLYSYSRPAADPAPGEQGEPASEDAEAPNESVFLHRATPESISSNSTYLDNPLTNGDPDARLFVTQNWNPGGGEGIYNEHPIGVWYDADRGSWAIFNQDRAPMPEGAAFNVYVSKDPAQAS